MHHSKTKWKFTLRRQGQNPDADSVFRGDKAVSLQKLYGPLNRIVADPKFGP